MHAAAEEGFTGSCVERYNRGRPSYVDEAVDMVFDILRGSGEGRNQISVVEIGAGTGKFTRSFLDGIARQQWLSGRDIKLIAVEPSEGFRENMQINFPDVDVVYGLGESLPCQDSSSDMIIAAQAFHWMATQETLQECHRVLRDDGTLLCIWNVIDLSDAWRMELEDILASHYESDDVPRHRTGKWRACFDADRARGDAALFEPLEEWNCRFDFNCTPEKIVDRVLSTSVISRLLEADKANVAEQVRDLLARHSDDRDANGNFNLVHRVEIVWCRVRK